MLPIYLGGCVVFKKLFKFISLPETGVFLWKEVKNITEIILSKEQRKTGIVLFDLLRRIKPDGSLSSGREWPPSAIVDSWHNVGSRAETIIAQSVAVGRSIQLFGFWGAGDKSEPDINDESFLVQLQIMNEKTSKTYKPGIEIMLLLADSHAGFNGYNQAADYLDQIGFRARQHGITVRMLSELYREWQLHIPNAHDPIDNSSDWYHGWTDPKFRRQRNQLVESAGRHRRNGANPEQAAYWYFVMRSQEKPYLAESFPNALIFANTSADLGGWLLPKTQMPILYMRAKPPWFQNGTPLQI